MTERGIPTSTKVDPLEVLLAEHTALWNRHPGGGDPVADREWNARVDEIEEQMASTAPTTKRGAIAGLRYVEWASERWVGGEGELRLLRHCINFLEATTCHVG